MTREIGNSTAVGSRTFSGKTLWLIVALSLGIRLVVFLIATPWQDNVASEFIVVGDALEYQELAERMLNDRPLGDLGVRRPPGYPAFLASIYYMFGTAPWVVILFQIALSGGITALLYLLTFEWFGKSAAFFAALLYAFEPHAVFSNISILSDTLFSFLFLLAIWFFALGIKSKRALPFLVTGALLALDTLVRPIGMYIPVILAGIAVVTLRADLTRGFSLSALMLCAFALSMSPWLLRNHSHYGAFALTDKGGEQLIYWVAPYTDVAITGKSIDEARELFAQMANDAGADTAATPFERSRIEQKVATGYVRQHFVDYTIVSLKGFRNALINLETKRIAGLLGLDSTALSIDWNNTATEVSGQLRSFFATKTHAEIVIAVYVASFLMLTYAAALLGGILAIRRSIWLPVVLTFVIISCFSAFVGPIGVARYKLPFIPLYLMLGGYGLMFVVHALRGTAGSEPHYSDTAAPST